MTVVQFLPAGTRGQIINVSIAIKVEMMQPLKNIAARIHKCILKK